MLDVGAALRCSTGGIRTGARLHRRRAATATAVAALAFAGLACATSGPSLPASAEAAAVRADLRAGLGFYQSQDFALAADRFASAAEGARRCRDLETLRRATTAECAARLRAGQVEAFSRCTQRLEPLVERRRHDPGVDTLISLGDYAGGRPPSFHRIPTPVRQLVPVATEDLR